VGRPVSRGNHQTAGQRRSSAPATAPRGRRHGRYPRRGAIVVVKHSIIHARRHVLTTGELYRAAAATTHPPLAPPDRRLVRQLEALGHTLTLCTRPKRRPRDQQRLRAG